MNYKKLNKKINFLLDAHNSQGIYKDKNGTVRNITKENLYEEIEDLKTNKVSKLMLDFKVEKLESDISKLNKYIETIDIENDSKVNYLGIISISISVAAILILLLR
ncbi:hypothetical protein HZP13_14445 [Elizabethkingia anophelis]|nr:hypothetical protein [Elizabethkingia anophelis]MCT4092786.1 hypothetical protein [Elizabethkingia anophelis]MCT4261580.1 hypothetical protein [Elizabethkingia anophelis]MCT4330915.1 hypothetical protein [Elizabethkingia anophelis]